MHAKLKSQYELIDMLATKLRRRYRIIEGVLLVFGTLLWGYGEIVANVFYAFT
jgi:hypothetical protein